MTISEIERGSRDDHIPMRIRCAEYVLQMIVGDAADAIPPSYMDNVSTLVARALNDAAAGVRDVGKRSYMAMCEIFPAHSRTVLSSVNTAMRAQLVKLSGDSEPSAPAPPQSSLRDFKRTQMQRQQNVQNTKSAFDNNPVVQSTTSAPNRHPRAAPHDTDGSSQRPMQETQQRILRTKSDNKPLEDKTKTRTKLGASFKSLISGDIESVFADDGDDTSSDTSSSSDFLFPADRIRSEKKRAEKAAARNRTHVNSLQETAPVVPSTEPPATSTATAQEVSSTSASNASSEGLPTEPGKKNRPDNGDEEAPGSHGAGNAEPGNTQSSEPACGAMNMQQQQQQQGNQCTGAMDVSAGCMQQQCQGQAASVSDDLDAHPGSVHVQVRDNALKTAQGGHANNVQGQHKAATMDATQSGSHDSTLLNTQGNPLHISNQKMLDRSVNQGPFDAHRATALQIQASPDKHVPESAGPPQRRRRVARHGHGTGVPAQRRAHPTNGKNNSTDKFLLPSDLLAMNESLYRAFLGSNHPTHAAWPSHPPLALPASLGDGLAENHYDDAMLDAGVQANVGTLIAECDRCGQQFHV